MKSDIFIISFIFQQLIKQVINTMAKNIRNIFSIPEIQRNAKEDKDEFFEVEALKDDIQCWETLGTRCFHALLAVTCSGS